MTEMICPPGSAAHVAAVHGPNHMLSVFGPFGNVTEAIRFGELFQCLEDHDPRWNVCFLPIGMEVVPVQHSYGVGDLSEITKAQEVAFKSARAHNEKG